METLIIILIAFSVVLALGLSLFNSPNNAQSNQRVDYMTRVKMNASRMKQAHV